MKAEGHLEATNWNYDGDLVMITNDYQKDITLPLYDYEIEHIAKWLEKHRGQMSPLKDHLHVYDGVMAMDYARVFGYYTESPKELAILSELESMDSKCTCNNKLREKAPIETICVSTEYLKDMLQIVGISDPEHVDISILKCREESSRILKMSWQKAGAKHEAYLAMVIKEDE